MIIRSVLCCVSGLRGPAVHHAAAERQDPALHRAPGDGGDHAGQDVHGHHHRLSHLLGPALSGKSLFSTCPPTLRKTIYARGRWEIYVLMVCSLGNFD